MYYYAVIDTNVLVSAMLHIDSIPGEVMWQALRGNIIPLYNKDIVAEYREVLHRTKFNFDPRTIKALLKGMIARGIPVDAGPMEEYLPDPKDAVFYAVVMEHRKNADAYLVTGNMKYFPQRSFIVTPREMLAIIQNQE